MKCALHLLARDERHAAFFTLAGLSLCTECTRQVGIRIRNLESVAEIVREATLGQLP